MSTIWPLQIINLQLRMKKTILILFYGLLALRFALAGGPWTPWKHKGIFIGSVSPVVYRTISDNNGGLTLHRRVSDIAVQIYGEYGITDELAVVLNWPFKYVRTGTTVLNDGELNDTLPSGRMICRGNIEMELKYKFYQKNKLVITGGLKGEAPTTKYREETGLRTGYECWSVIPTIHLGVGISERIYTQFMGAFAFRTNDYSDEWRAAVEVGYKLKKPFWIAVLVQARQSLKNGSRDDADLSLSNNLHTGLYLNDEQYYAWAFKFSYNINERLGVNWSLGGGIKTLYIARTPAFSFGIFYDWQQDKKERI